MPEGLFIFNPAIGKELELNYVTTTPVHGTGGKTRTAQVAMGATLQLGDLSFDGQNVIVLTEAGELAHMGVDGVIGAVVFNRYVTAMDFDTATLTLHDPADFDPTGFGDAIAMTVTATRPYVQAEVAVDGGVPNPVTLFVDSGASAALVLYTTTLESLAPPETSVAAVVSSGVGGDVEGVVGRVSRLDLGPHRLTEIVSRFPHAPQGSANGTLGMGVLRRFVVAFDYGNARLFLRPAASFAEPFEYNMAGLVLRPRAGGRLSVHSVLARSPAARNGIQRGDVIVAIDGHRLERHDDAVIRRMFKQHDKTVVLTIDRDGDQIDITITLERII